MKHSRVWLIILLVLFSAFTIEVVNQQRSWFDAGMRDVMLNLQQESLTVFFKTIAWFGTVPAFGLLFMVAATILVVRRKLSHALVLLLGTIGSWGINQVIKDIVQRPRPPGDALIAAEGFSYPSGNAMIAVTFYLLLAFYLQPVLRTNIQKSLLMFSFSLLVLLIGISRIYLGVHYPSDIIAGFSLGGVWFICMRFLLWRIL